MKKIVSALLMLSALTGSVFAAVPTVKMQCPPASALRHVYGRAWTVDPSAKSVGWSVVQAPDTNWTRLAVLPTKTVLTAFFEGEDTKDFGNFPYFVSCAYQYGTNPYEMIVLKSAYPMVENSLSGFSADSARSGVMDCQTTGDKAGACTWDVRSVAVKPMERG